MSTEMKDQSANNELIITRTFNAPLELVFKAFTEAEHLAQWWGPKGFSITIHKLDLRPGGTFHYNMKSSDSSEMWGIFHFKEIAYPNRIVFINSFSDPDGNITRPPFSDDWPLEIVNEFTFHEQDNNTIMNLRSYPVNANPDQQRTFTAGHSSMQEGYGGTFDQLEEHLFKMIGDLTP
ncbi:SRPBCC domain-containing protein [Paradesertivirga mongoliensis]|uniref:SRPBCC domain-containing protein n=1 Tax=Paradesertivirga mongoliensis TaxID=2100740 RepID=A0ABW4ZMZ1_9SPHI|nr:SRPBCC domain-containing protein [Pedobacter mongoliensis]